MRATNCFHHLLVANVVGVENLKVLPHLFLCSNNMSAPNHSDLFVQSMEILLQQQLDLSLYFRFSELFH